MARIKLKYVMSDIDRHGNVRHYFRRGKTKKIRLPGLPGSAEFSEAYQAALQAHAPALPTLEGSFLWLCRQFYKSPTFRALDPRSQRVRQLILDKFCEKHGQKPFRLMRRKHVEDFRDARQATPGAATNLLKALRHVFKYAVSRDWVEVNPARDVPYLRKRGDGFHTWTIEEVRQFEEHWPVGSKPRLALALLLYTGQRRSDVVTLGRQHERNGVLRYRQRKTNQQMATPILPALRVVLDATPTTGLTYLQTQLGKPFTSNGFGNAFREWCDAAGLPHCSAHGLRKAGASFAAENGATEAQLKAIYGWETLTQASLYTKAARRERLARDAQHLVMPEER
jgi:integrase